MYLGDWWIYLIGLWAGAILRTQRLGRDFRNVILLILNIHFQWQIESLRDLVINVLLRLSFRIIAFRRRLILNSARSNVCSNIFIELVT